MIRNRYHGLGIREVETMREYFVSNEKVQSLKKQRLISVFWRYALLFIALIWILFIGKTLDLGSTVNNVAFFIFLVVLSIVVDQFTAAMLVAQVKNQSYKLTDIELIKFEKGELKESFLFERISNIKENKNGVLVENSVDKKRVFISNLFYNYEELLIKLKQAVGQSSM